MRRPAMKAARLGQAESEEAQADIEGNEIQAT